MTKATKKPTGSDEDRNRTAKLLYVTEVLPILESLIQTCREKRKKLVLLQSVSEGLYEETDKLTKKAASESATDLMLEQVNDLIKEVKELADDDPFVSRLKVFVAAGDNPELRDVLVVLRQLRQGMDRYSREVEGKLQKYKARSSAAETISLGIRYYQKFRDKPHKPYFVEHLGKVSDDWIKRSPGTYDDLFNLEKVDRTDLKEYFEIDN